MKHGWVINSGHGGLLRNKMIPKNIFTICIFEKDVPEIFYRCFESWHRLMPDWNIQVISLENVEKSDYVKARLAEKNYVMAGHWARLWYMYTYGGIYVDIDIEAVKRWDKLLDNGFFLGHEGDDKHLNNAMMGGVAGHPFIKEMLDYTEAFDLSHPEHPNETGPRMVTKLMIQKGWDRRNVDQVVDGITCYNSKRFYPYFWKSKYTPECVTDDTFAIHHWSSSWQSEEIKKAAELRIKELYAR